MTKTRLEEAEALLRDCAEHFKVLNKHGVHVWPNHPLNPETRIAEFLRGTHEPEKP